MVKQFHFLNEIFIYSLKLFPQNQANSINNEAFLLNEPKLPFPWKI